MTKQPPAEDLSMQQGLLLPFYEKNDVPKELWPLFGHYFSLAPVGVRPEYTWNKFEGGLLKYGSYEGYDLSGVDELGEGLIPNYRHAAESYTAVLDALKPLGRQMSELLKTNSLLVVSNHPTFASPVLTARSVIEALREQGVTDIQDRTYLTYGLHPTVFEYDFGAAGTISPVGIASGIGNLLLTASVADSNLNPDIKPFQDVIRQNYKSQIESILGQPGNIVVLILNGQRDVQFSDFNKKARKIHRPEGDVSLFAKDNVMVVNIGLYDQLLETGDLRSLVQMYPDMHIRPATRWILEEAHVFQAASIHPTFDRTNYYAEKPGDFRQRMKSRGLSIGREVLSRAVDLGRRP